MKASTCQTKGKNNLERLKTSMQRVAPRNYLENAKSRPSSRNLAAFKIKHKGWPRRIPVMMFNQQIKMDLNVHKMKMKFKIKP